MAKAILEDKLDSASSSLQVSSAGTMAIENLPSSRRVEKALNEYGLTAAGHRSRQIDRQLADWADLIVGFEPHHIEYVRRHFEDAAKKTGLLHYLVELKPSDELNLAEGIIRLKLDDAAALENFREVADPDRGGDAEMADCAKNISLLLEIFWQNWGRKLTDGN